METAIQELGIKTKANALVERPTQGLSIKADQKSQIQLADLLSQCFDGLRMYGKNPEQLTNTVKLFRLVLADFTIEQINKAFVTHLQRSNEMPTPSEIVGLIQRDGRPPLDKSVYVALVQKRERTTMKYSYGTYDDLTNEEKEYISEYEKFNIKGVA